MKNPIPKLIESFVIKHLRKDEARARRIIKEAFPKKHMAGNPIRKKEAVNG